MALVYSYFTASMRSMGRRARAIRLSAESSTRGSRIAQSIRLQFLDRVAPHVRAFAAIALLICDEIKLLRRRTFFERVPHAALPS